MTEYFEDVAVGDTETTDTYVVDREEIIEFASQYDPQPMHTDPEAAADSMFGGLVASGWHTGAMTMRLLVDDVLRGSGALGALGIDELRFPSPVRPGDELAVETEVLEKDTWDDERGLVVTRVETTAGDRTVLTMTTRVLWKRRTGQ